MNPPLALYQLLSLSSPHQRLPTSHKGTRKLPLAANARLPRQASLMCFETIKLSTFYFYGFSDLWGTFREKMQIPAPLPFVLPNKLNQPLCRYHSATVLINTSTNQIILSGASRPLAYPSMKLRKRQCQGGRLNVFPEAHCDSATVAAARRALLPQSREFVSRSWIALEDPTAMPWMLHSAISWMVHPATLKPMQRYSILIYPIREQHLQARGEPRQHHHQHCRENTTTPNPLRALHGTCATLLRLKWCLSPLQGIHLKTTKKHARPKPRFEMEMHNQVRRPRLAR